MRRVLPASLALALALSAVAVTGVAHAECMAPQPFIAAPSDGVVPPNPVVYVFTPRWMTLEKVRVEARDQATVGIAREPVGGTESWSASKVRITAAKAGKIAVVAVIRGYGETTFELRRELTIATPKPTTTPKKATVVDYGVSRYGWTCSHEDVRKLGVDVAAPAYRVELMVGDEVRRSSVFPDSSDRFFSSHDDSEELPVVLKLGHINCQGDSFEWRAIDMARLRITALMTDGSEVTSGPVGVPSPRSERPDEPQAPR